MINIADIFLFVMLIGNFYFLTSRRLFDSFSLAFFSLNFYFLPAFFGYVLYPVGGKLNVVREIEPAAYFVFLFLPVSILMISKLYDATMLRQQRTYQHLSAKSLAHTPVRLQISFALALGFSFLGYFLGGAALFSGDKTEVLAAEGRSYLMGIYFCLLTGIYAYQTGSKKIFICIILILLINVFVGHRSNMAIFVLSICLLKIQGNGRGPLIKKNKRVVIALAFIAVVFFAYKWFYIGIKTGNYDLIAQRLNDPRLLMLIFGESEPFFTQSILNEVVGSNFTIDISQYFYSFLVIFPFMDGFIEPSLVSFNEVFQSQLFSSIEYGIAANFWAQGWAAGGWLGFVAIAFFYNGMLWFLNLLMRTKSPFFKTLIVISISYWAFYVHRNDFVQMLSVEKRLLYSGLIIWTLAFFLTRPRRSRISA